MMQNENLIYVLVDSVTTGEYVKYSGGPLSMSPEKLKEHFHNLTTSIAKSLEGCVSPTREMQLDEIAVEVGFDAEYGVVLVAKAGVKGAITLKYKRQKNTTEKMD